MIIALLISLLGNGQLEIFYIDNLDKGVKEYVVDKQREKEIQDTLKSVTKTIKEFYKNREKQVKELEKKNEDSSTPKQWYQDFFDNRIEERKELQAYAIKTRIFIQSKITSMEWTGIIKMASADVTIEEMEAQKKAMKENDKNIFKNLEAALVEEIQDTGKRSVVMAALKDYEKKNNEIADAYGGINVNESSFLADQNASEDELLRYCKSLIEIREDLYGSYLEFFFILRENTNDDERKAIIKQFNKVLE